MIRGIAFGRNAQSGEYRAAYTLADTQLLQRRFASDAERTALAQVQLTARKLATGKDLIREGASPDYLYFLTAGWAFRYVTTRSGGRQISTLLVPGSVCNLDNFLFERADFGVRAATSATVLMLPRVQALAVAAKHPGVSRAFTWLALLENAILTQWAVGLGRRSALARLAHLLCELMVRVSPGDAPDGSFDLPLTQEQIADVIGLTPVHVNRTLQHLRTQRLIITNGRKITIPDFSRLQAVAEFDADYLRRIKESAAPPPMGTASAWAGQRAGFNA